MKVPVIVLLCAYIVISGAEENSGWKTRMKIDKIMLPETESGQESSISPEDISIFRVWQDNMYWAIPRDDGNQPITLGVLSVNNPDGSTINGHPYPTLQYQDFQNCSAFQSVTSLEIDPWGKLWVLDNGSQDCPPQLVVLELKYNGRHWRSFTINHPSIIPQTVSVEYDNMVLEHVDCGFVYMRYRYAEGPGEKIHGIAVYSLKDVSIWAHQEATFHAWLHETAYDPGHGMLSLSPIVPGRTLLYYGSPEASQVHGLPTHLLRQNSLDANIIGVECGFRFMVTTAKGVTYMGTDDAPCIREQHSISTWELNGPPESKPVHGSTTLEYADLVTIDGKGMMWGFQRGESFYSLVAYDIGSPDYQYYANGSEPHRLGNHEYEYCYGPNTTTSTTTPPITTTSTTTPPITPSKPVQPREKCCHRHVIAKVDTKVKITIGSGTQCDESGIVHYHNCTKDVMHHECNHC